MNSIPMSTRSLATAAIAGMATFPVLVLVLHLIQHATYHPMADAISELALGRAGWLMFVAFTASGTGTLCAAVLLRRTTDSHALPGLLVAASALTYVSAVFHADGETAKTTLHGEIHQTAGIAEFVLIIVAMFVASRAFRRTAQWRPMARPTLIWGCGSLATFFLIPTMPSGDFGVAQRIFIATWFSWMLAVALYGRRLQAVPGRGGEPQPGTMPARATST